MLGFLTGKEKKTGVLKMLSVDSVADKYYCNHWLRYGYTVQIKSYASMKTDFWEKNSNKFNRNRRNYVNGLNSVNLHVSPGFFFSLFKYAVLLKNDTNLVGFFGIDLVVGGIDKTALFFCACLKKHILLISECKISFGNTIGL